MVSGREKAIYLRESLCHCVSMIQLLLSLRPNTSGSHHFLFVWSSHRPTLIDNQRDKPMKKKSLTETCSAISFILLYVYASVFHRKIPKPVFDPPPPRPASPLPSSFLAPGGPVFENVFQDTAVAPLLDNEAGLSPGRGWRDSELARHADQSSWKSRHAGRHAGIPLSPFAHLSLSVFFRHINWIRDQPSRLIL